LALIERFLVRSLRACLGSNRTCVDQVGDFTSVLDVEPAEVAGDVDRRAAARGPAALLPARHLAVIHGTFSAGDQPAVRLGAVGPLRNLLPDLPATSHAVHLKQNARPFARGEMGRRSPPVPVAGRHQPAGLCYGISISDQGPGNNDARHVFPDCYLRRGSYIKPDGSCSAALSVNGSTPDGFYQRLGQGHGLFGNRHGLGSICTIE